MSRIEDLLAGPSLTEDRAAELRAGLLAAAISLPDGTHRPRALRRRPAWRLGLGVAAVAVLVSALTSFLSLRAPEAWSAVPLPVSGQPKAATIERCRRLVERVLPPTGFPGPSPTPQLVNPVGLAERRGTTTSALLESPGVVAACIGTSNASGASIGALPQFPNKATLAIDDSSAQFSGRTNIRVLAGRLRTTVARVQVRTSDGRTVKATISNGLFLAWWPSKAEATRVIAYGANGSRVVAFDPRSTASK